jgi:hypothetical protein
MRPIPCSLLLADIGDLLQAAAPIIFMILYGVAQLVGGKKQPGAKPAPRPRPLPPEAAGMGPIAAGKPGGNAGANPPSLEETLRREVEDFLKRAQGQAPPAKPSSRPSQPQRDQRGRPAPQTPPAARRVARQEPQREAPVRRLTQQSRPASPSRTIAPPLQPAPPAPTPLGSGVVQYVSDQMRGTKAIVEHAEKLGADVAQADERMQQHLQERFVHKLGSLAPQTTSIERRPTASPLAQDLLTMLTRPGGARQIVLAGEILRRPDDRWQ